MLLSLQAETLAALTKKQSSINATLLADCVNMRLIVYQKVAGSTISSQPVKRAVYKWVSQHRLDALDAALLFGGLFDPGNQLTSTAGSSNCVEPSTGSAGPPHTRQDRL